MITDLIFSLVKKLSKSGIVGSVRHVSVFIRNWSISVSSLLHEAVATHVV